MRQCCSQSLQKLPRGSHGRRWQTKISVRHAVSMRLRIAQLTPPTRGVSLKLFYDGTMHEIK